MTRSPLHDAFGHHIWATVRLIDACLDLHPDQLATAPHGTYGSIIETLRHLVGADTAYLYLLLDTPAPDGDEGTMDLLELRAAIEANGRGWSDLVERDLDPDRVVVRHRDDGSESHAPLGIRLAQALHHGTDHRSQVCTALTTIGIEPPAIDVWDYAEEDGRLREVPGTG